MVELFVNGMAKAFFWGDFDHQSDDNIPMVKFDYIACD
jgi:hypothetical protein